jgi:hypothetical protein
MTATWARAVGVLVLLTIVGGLGGCAVVPQNRRKHLADPMMRFDADGLAAYKRQKFYSTREGAAGGDGTPAGGGCGCQ